MRASNVKPITPRNHRKRRYDRGIRCVSCRSRKLLVHGAMSARLESYVFRQSNLLACLTSSAQGSSFGGSYSCDLLAILRSRREQAEPSWRMRAGPRSSCAASRQDQVVVETLPSASGRQSASCVAQSRQRATEARNRRRKRSHRAMRATNLSGRGRRAWSRKPERWRGRCRNLPGQGLSVSFVDVEPVGTYRMSGKTRSWRRPAGRCPQAVASYLRSRAARVCLRISLTQLDVSATRLCLLTPRRFLLVRVRDWERDRCP